MKQFAPERIFATVNGQSTRLPDGARQWVGGWSQDNSRSGVTEYVRADIAVRDQWQPMDTAPLDGKHCILAVQEGAFIYSVQGSFDGRRWNAVHAVGVKPLCWMPNVRLPSEFLPASFQPSTTSASKGQADE